MTPFARMKTRIQNWWLWLAGAVGAAIVTLPAEAATPHSLAVLGSSELRATGLSDLALAELSKVDGLRLVERERLDVVAREYATSVFSANLKAADRVKLGRLIGADTLVLLSLTGERTNAWVKLVVSDCQSGARLRMESWPFEKSQLGRIVERIKGAVLDTRKSYPQGVQQVVGVAPFVSRNLTHEFDYLQRRYAYQLQQTLAAVPGVAVMETEEALAIQNELALTATSGVGRVVPALVEGEFSVEARGTSAAPQLTLTVRIARPPEPAATVRRGPVTLAEAAAFLTRELPPQILRAEVLNAPGQIAPERQFDWLVERANQMAQLGFWADSVGLREAALLLRPDHLEQRLKLIDDYTQAIASPLPEVAEAGDWKFDHLPIRIGIRRRVDWYLARLGHLELILRQRSVPLERAMKLTEQCVNTLLAGYNLEIKSGRYRRLGEDELRLAEDAKAEFIRRVMPELLAWIDAAPGYKSDFLERWQRVIFTAFDRTDRTYRTTGDLDFMREAMTRIIPDLLPAAQLPGRKRYATELPGVKEVTEAEWRGFLQELESSGHRMSSLYARAAAIRLDQERPGKSAAEYRALLAKADAWLQDYAATPFRVPYYQARTGEGIYSRMTDLRRWIARDLERLEQPGQPQPQYVAPKHEDRSGLGRMRFAEIDLKIRHKADRQLVSAKGVRYPIDNGVYYLRNWLQCGDALDVVWHPGVVLFHRDKGVLDEVFVDNKLAVENVGWDGRAVWIATKRDGVWVVKPDGRVVNRFAAASGLPPTDNRILVQPLTNGSAIAVGSFGPQSRAWCALLQCDDRGGGSVRVFHEATRVRQADEAKSPELEANPALCFSPNWLHYYQAKDGSTRLLVGRGRNRPLEINPATLGVSVFERKLYQPDYHESDAYFSHAGFLLEVDVMGVTLRPPPGERFEDGKESRTMCPDRLDWQTVGAQGGFAKQLLAYDGWVYAPGGTWWRIDPKTWKSERLVPWRVPREYEALRNFSVSAHYGLVGWEDSGRAFYRVTVASEADSR